MSKHKNITTYVYSWETKEQQDNREWLEREATMKKAAPVIFIIVLIVMLTLAKSGALL